MNEVPATTPESVGISSRTLLRMMEKLSGLQYVNSIIIRRHGRSVLEAWQAPYRRETPHLLFSLSKSFTSCAIGMAQAEGKLKITDRLISFFPEYADCITDDRMRSVTLKDLLTMRSGHLSCATKYMLKHLTDDRPHPAAAYAVWTNESKLEIRSFICDGTYRDIWTMDFSDPEEPLKNRILCSCFRPGKPRFGVVQDGTFSGIRDKVNDNVKIFLQK